MIPFFGLDRQYSSIKDEILAATDQVLSSGKVLDGDYTRRFEQAIAKRCQRSFAVAVNSGTSALIFAQKWLSNPEPVKILIPSISFVATLNSVLYAGNQPQFCDVDYNGNIDLESLNYSLDGNVSGIMFVNLFGRMVDWDKFTVITKFFNDNLFVIEDAAQSFGASYKGRPSGSFGDVSILSFDPTKNLPSYGSGGMLLTDDSNAYNYFRDLHNHGKQDNFSRAGTNSKMSESDCAQMLVKLEHFDQWQARREKIAEYYNQEFNSIRSFGFVTPAKCEDSKHAWHKYVVRSNDRNTLQLYLDSKGIETKVHYNIPLFEYECGWPFVNYAQDLYKEASSFTYQCLSLPIYPELTDAEVEHIVNSIKLFHRRRKDLKTSA